MSSLPPLSKAVKISCCVPPPLRPCLPLSVCLPLPPPPFSSSEKLRRIACPHQSSRNGQRNVRDGDWRRREGGTRQIILMDGHLSLVMSTLSASALCPFCGTDNFSLPVFFRHGEMPMPLSLASSAPSSCVSEVVSEERCQCHGCRCSPMSNAVATAAYIAYWPLL